MRWIYLSPHLDDVALSCGGLIREQRKAGQKVEIWSVFAGDPPGKNLSPFAEVLHQRWKISGNPVKVRREEDLEACRLLDVTPNYFNYPDCIYRRFPGSAEPVIQREEDLFASVDERETYLIEWIQNDFRKKLSIDDYLVIPITIGGHIDHQITRLAAEALSATHWYYAEYPYVLRKNSMLEEYLNPAWDNDSYQIGQESLTIWQDSIAAYQSQISTFWDSVSAMSLAIQSYWEAGGGSRIWTYRTGQDRLRESIIWE